MDVWIAGVAFFTPWADTEKREVGTSMRHEHQKEKANRIPPDFKREA